MSFGRDVRNPDLTMTPAPVPGGLEPRLFPGSREEVRAAVAARVEAYVPEWTDRSSDDAGVALVRVHGTVGAAVTGRLNRLPRRLALTQLALAGVRPRPGTPARALLAAQIADRSPAAVAIAPGMVWVTPAGSAGPVLENEHGCTALPGRVATVGVLADGWLVLDIPDALPAVAPFGRRRQPPAELWIGIQSPVAPTGLLSLAVRLAPQAGRPIEVRSAATPVEAVPALRWEALTAAGPAELAVERDDTGGLTRSGVLVLRADTRSPWSPRTLPGRQGDPPATWLRARLTTGRFPPAPLLASVTLNGLSATARRTIRDEVAEPIERRASGRSRYRLSQAPVVPGSVDLQVADTAADPFGTEAAELATWREVASLASADPGDRVFLLEPSTGILTFGDGITGRAVPAGYRNVVAASYATGGGRAGLPRAGAVLAPERSLPGLTGAAVLAITTGADAENAAGALLRGGASLRSRLRAVAAADYASLGSGTPGVSVARAHCLPARDARLGAATRAGAVTVVVLPVAEDPDRPPVPSAAVLGAVADHLARTVGVVGTSVVAVAPAFREIAVTALLVGAPGADLGQLESAARDRINSWLSPTTGADGTGWPFGGTVRWDALVRVLVADVAGLAAVARLSFRSGGRRLPPCTDVPLAPDELVWPGTHVLETEPGRAGP